MAGTIAGWLLEYVYHISWDTFRKKRSIDEDNCRDIIQWLISNQTVVRTENTKHMMQLQILLQMSRLTDGENYETRYADENDYTVLEDMLVSFKGLATCLPESYQPMMEKNKDLIIRQAVLVPCRCGDFDTAESVFMRISSQVTDKAIVESLKGVLATKSKGHKYITNKANSYATFVSECVTMFTEFNKEFDVPFLVQIAEGQERLRERRKNIKHAARNERLVVLKTLSNRKGTGKLSSPTKEPEMREALGTIRTRALDNLLDDVSPLPKKVRENEDSVFKSPSKVASRPSRTATKDDGEDDRTDLDLSPLRKPKGFRQFSYKRNINRPDRHAIDVTDHDKPDHLGTSKSNGKQQLKWGGGYLPMEKKVKNKYGAVSSPIRPRQSVLRPPSPTESVFSSRKTPWGLKETEDFYQGVQEFGVGKWSEICSALGTFRTNVNLKDKWRSIQKTGQIHDLEKKFGPV
ncbi:telomeric repeat-binding factor 2-like [Argopecten irradians]|uniref:telomeric repeat-binding factor 2-like n=1 Tax=Argopecten irradians TaxID=31199 RepID=UPI0037192E72